MVHSNLNAPLWLQFMLQFFSALLLVVFSVSSPTYLLGYLHHYDQLESSSRENSLTVFQNGRPPETSISVAQILSISFVPQNLLSRSNYRQRVPRLALRRKSPALSTCCKSLRTLFTLVFKFSE